MPNLNAAVTHFSTFKSPGLIASPLSPVLTLKFDFNEKSFNNEKVSLSKDLYSVNLSSKDNFKKGHSTELDFEVLNQFYETKLQLIEPTEIKPPPMNNLECSAIECDEIMKKDFKSLFLDHNIQKDSYFSVITLSQKTINDMTSWNPDVEEEREALLENFIAGAKNICNTIKEAGYWADFVDPESGRPFFSAYTTDTFFETDHRYKKLGFEIQDLGCCKVIAHLHWGVHVYVGSLFTNAPIDHPTINKLTQYSKND